MALDHAHRRADLVGEARDERRDRGQLLRDARLLARAPQRGALVLDLALELAALRGELLGQVVEVALARLDVGLHRELRVEEQELLERRRGARAALRVAAARRGPR